jgi:hypothetical protein
MGESILPFRVFRPLESLIPVDSDGTVLDAEAAASRGYTGLHSWMKRAETLWAQNNDADRMSLIQRWNYHNELGAQFPVAPLRVVYSKAGTLLAATTVADPTLVIENSLYWYSAASLDEASYLSAILNSEAARRRVEALQAKGQWGARHFDKVMFTLPIPLFDGRESRHAELARLGREAEAIAAAVPLAVDARFQAARSKVRRAISEAGVSSKIDSAVDQLLDTQ